jgi:hypothetical protein
MFLLSIVFAWEKRDSVCHHRLETISETAAVLELEQKASTHHPLWVVVVVYKIVFPVERTTPTCDQQTASRLLFLLLSSLLLIYIYIYCDP